MDNEAYKVIMNRHSCRKFLDKEVPDELIDKVVAAGLAAPTGRNSQQTYFLAVKDPEVIEEIRKLNAAIMGATSLDPFYGGAHVARERFREAGYRRSELWQHDEDDAYDYPQRDDHGQNEADGALDISEELVLCLVKESEDLALKEIERDVEDKSDAEARRHRREHVAELYEQRKDDGDVPCEGIYDDGEQDYQQYRLDIFAVEFHSEPPAGHIFGRGEQSPF